MANCGPSQYPRVVQVPLQITTKTPAQIIFSIQTTHYKFILEHTRTFLQITASTFVLCATYLHSEIGRQNNFSTPWLNSWNGKFPIGSLYEFTSCQNNKLWCFHTVNNLLKILLDQNVWMYSPPPPSPHNHILSVPVPVCHR